MDSDRSHPLTYATIGMLLVAGATCVWSLIENVHRVTVIKSLNSGHLGPGSLAAAQAADDHVRDASVGTSLSLIVCGIVFIAWLYRMSVIVHDRRPGTSQYSTGWAVGGWFVPFLNLARPVQVVADVWRSATTSERYHEPLPFWIGLWWAAWLLPNLAYVVARAFIAGTPTFSDYIAHDRTYAVARLGSTIAAGLAIVVVREVSARVAALPPAPQAAPMPLYAAIGMVFNTPPGWPVPPPGWAPPPGWQPDPAWPPAPANWQFWMPSGG